MRDSVRMVALFTCALSIFPGSVGGGMAHTRTSSVDSVGQPGGRLVFYRSQPSGANGDLYVMDSDGGNQVRIGGSGSRPDHYPNWSPDGRTLVFTSYRQGGWRIWTMERDGSRARRIVPGGMGTSSYEYDPSFSSDGRSVLYVSGGNIHRIGLDGQGRKQITRTPDTFEFSPQESPDGSAIAFTTSEQGKTRIVRAAPDGSQRMVLTDDSSISYAPVWSRDGKRILFYSDRDGSFELYLMQPDGSNQRPLLTPQQRAAAGFTRAPFVDAFDDDWGAVVQYKASFSCDDARIAFSREVDGNREIYTVAADGSDLRRITRNRLHDGFPMWSPCAK